MTLQIESKTLKWLASIQILSPTDSAISKIGTTTFAINQQLANLFQNGLKISQIVIQLCKKKGIPIPSTLNHMKNNNHTAAKLYNWNILNQALKKMSFQVDSQSKNLIINGDRTYLAIMLRKLQSLYQQNQIQDSLETQKLNNQNYKKRQQNNLKESLTLSKSEEPPINQTNYSKHARQSQFSKQSQVNQQYTPTLTLQGDLLQYIVGQLMNTLKLTRKQSIALLSDNNKYLAHVLVKGIKGQFTSIQQLIQKWYANIDYIVQKMIQQNDMCFFFLQVVKPSLLSKSQQIAQWGCRILSKVAFQLANKQMLPLAYDWFVREAGGLSTTILALSRHPSLNQHVVSYILQFSRFNVTELFTIQLKKITNNDSLAYIKFLLLIFDSLVQSKLSAQQLLNSGAIDYWVQSSIKFGDNDIKNTIQLRLYSIQFLIKIWRSFPIHVQQTLDQVNGIMSCIKRGIRQNSQIMRFSLVELMFNLLDQFASKKNPYASIVYKKLTFLFIENHQELTMRQFMLRNFGVVFEKYQSIPIQIFLQPFVKQVKISQSKSYFVNIFDMEFIQVAVKHRKLKVNIALQLYDLLAKTKLNSHSFAYLAQVAMNILLDRFLQEDIFFQYTVKLVKISLAMFFSTLKHKKQFDDHEHLQAQKRAQIINFIISLVQRENTLMNQQIKTLVIHVKIRVHNLLNTTHKGIQRILSYFHDVQEAIMEAQQNLRDQTQSNATSTKSKSQFHLPKIQSRNMINRQKDQTTSQQSFQTNTSKFSKQSKQQFPQKDYTQFAQQDEKKFYKQNGIDKKKNQQGANFRTKVTKNSGQKDIIDPKVMSNIYKAKQKKQQEQIKKMKQKQTLEKKKQILKQKIQKQLQQRNIKDGLKGNQKDVEVKVVFEQNQLSDQIFQSQENDGKNICIQNQQERDRASIRLVLRKYLNFVKKIFNKYSSANNTKKEYFQAQNLSISQVDLIKFCKQKNLQKSKPPILEIMKEVNNKNIKSMEGQIFPSFLQSLCIYLYFKQKSPTRIPMGDYMKGMLKKMVVGQINIKLEDQDEQSKSLTEKIRYNPHMSLPDGYKKIAQNNYIVNKNCSYPTKKAIKKSSYIECFQVLQDILLNIFKMNIIQEEVLFKEELRVIPKKQNLLPPKPNVKKQKQTEKIGFLLTETQSAPIKKNNTGTSRQKDRSKINNQQRSGSMQKQNSRPKAKIVNAAQKKKIQQEQQKRIKQQQQEQIRKMRQQQVKKKLQRQQQQREKQKQKKKVEQKAEREKQQQRRKKQIEQKQLYKQKQKEKLQKYKREQQTKQKQEKEKARLLRDKEDVQKKEKLKSQMKDQQQKRKLETQKMKKQRELSEQKAKKKKQEEQNKKQKLKNQVMKKLQQQKGKYETEKIVKEVLKKIYSEPSITEAFNQYKQQLKALYNYGKQFNQYKLGTNTQNLQAKGWMQICQQFNICDVNTSNKLIKFHQKQSGSSGFTYEGFLQTIFSYKVKNQLENDIQDYEKAVKSCQSEVNSFLKNLKIPRDKQLLKDYFLQLKSSQKGKGQKNSKEKTQMMITNKKGEKQNWQVQQN